MSSVERARMVEVDLARQGISDSRVLDAFRSVAREDFVPPELGEFAYKDAPLVLLVLFGGGGGYYWRSSRR